MTRERVNLTGAVVSSPRRFDDVRGFSRELWNAECWAENGLLPRTFVQANDPRSVRDVLRGMDLQRRRPQGTWVTVIRGEILAVVVDLGPRAATFGRSAAFELGEAKSRALTVPRGFTQGFLVGSDLVDVVYHTTVPYRPGDKGTLLWDDPCIVGLWPAGKTPRLTAKDAAPPTHAFLASLQAVLKGADTSKRTGSSKEKRGGSKSGTRSDISRTPSPG